MSSSCLFHGRVLSTCRIRVGFHSASPTLVVAERAPLHSIILRQIWCPCYCNWWGQKRMILEVLIKSSMPSDTANFSSSLAILSHRALTYLTAAPPQGRMFLLCSVSLWEDHDYVICCNKLPYLQALLCWSGGWNLYLTHCHWTCLGFLKIGWEPCRSGAIEFGLASAATNANRCIHY